MENRFDLIYTNLPLAAFLLSSTHQKINKVSGLLILRTPKVVWIIELCALPCTDSDFNLEGFDNEKLKKNTSKRKITSILTVQS